MVDFERIKYVPYAIIIFLVGIYLLSDILGIHISPKLGLGIACFFCWVIQMIAMKNKDSKPFGYIFAFLFAFIIVNLIGIMIPGLVFQKLIIVALSLVIFFSFGKIKKVFAFFEKKKKCAVCGRAGAVYSIMQGRKSMNLCEKHMATKFKELMLQSKGKMVIMHPKLYGKTESFTYQFFEEKHLKGFGVPNLKEFFQESVKNVESGKVAYYGPEEIIYTIDKTSMICPDFEEINATPEIISLDAAIDRIKGELCNKRFEPPIVVPKEKDNGILFLSEI